VTYSKWD